MDDAEAAREAAERVAALRRDFAARAVARERNMERAIAAVTEPVERTDEERRELQARLDRLKRERLVGDSVTPIDLDGLL